MAGEPYRGVSSYCGSGEYTARRVDTATCIEAGRFCYGFNEQGQSRGGWITDCADDEIGLRRDFGPIELRAMAFHDLPDDLLGQSITRSTPENARCHILFEICSAGEAVCIRITNRS